MDANVMNRQIEQCAESNASVEGEELTASKSALLEASHMVTDTTFSILHELAKASGGAPFELAICAAGALAGYACKVAALVYVSTSRDDHQYSTTEIGLSHVYEERIFYHLLEAEYSIVNIAKKICERFGHEFDIDVGEIIGHTRESMGMPSYGMPRVELSPERTGNPAAHVCHLWPSQSAAVQRRCPSPESWPILFGLTINNLLVMGKSTVDPMVAVRLALEAAIPMSMISVELDCLERTEHTKA